MKAEKLELKSAMKADEDCQSGSDTMWEKVVFGKKQRGIIVERSRGFTSWIRFGESSLGWLLEEWRLVVGGKKEKSYVEVVNTREVPREKKARGGSVDSTGRRRCGKRKGVFGPLLGWELGRDGVMDSNLRDMEKWGKHHWKLQGGMRIARMGGFSREQVKEVWVRVMGLPLHLWSREVFKKIGDCCGGFVAVDESTGALKELQWARILVKLEGIEGPSSLQVVIGTTCYAIQLWWEMLPRVTDVIPASRFGTGKKLEMAVPSEDGESSCRPALETTSSDMIQTRGAVAERQKDGGENLPKVGPAVKANGRSGWVLDSEAERRPSEEIPVAIKEVSGLDLLGPPLKVTKPKAQKGPTEEDRLEVCGPPHLGPLPNIPAKEMGRPQLVPHKGSAGFGHPISYPIVPAGVRAREACREEAYGWPDRFWSAPYRARPLRVVTSKSLPTKF
ncbi:hypothetical protein CK203_047013 [Vitis vinifera]|uniref:Uncharacterized protein n=1 Tax=Vitis vinifera TaxID=29760 RepID=A0A438FWI7_VITVI|nr:hypothetical protein CK203_047013 [Vitis vinifera]